MTIGHKRFTESFELPYDLADWFEQASFRDRYTDPLEGRTVRLALQAYRENIFAECASVSSDPVTRHLTPRLEPGDVLERS